MVKKLRYGNTNTFFVQGTGGALLVDTDFAGTLPAFYRAIKEQGVGMREITHVLATHYHPDHIGLISANIPPLQRDWARVMHDHPRIIYYAHADEKALR